MAALKKHTNDKHPEDNFKFTCELCKFEAQAPKFLREHITKAHGETSGLTAATLAVIDTQLVGPRDAVVTNPADLEIVTLGTATMPEMENTWGADPEIVMLDVEDMSDMESEGPDKGWMCAVCLVIFRTERQWEYHSDWEECESPPPSPRESTYCEVCHAEFCSAEENDRHEPCPQNEANKIAEKSRETRSHTNQILCRYCKKHCEATIADPRYARTVCLPRISNREQTYRRQSLTATAAPAAHGTACPGLREINTGGQCTLRRHKLEPPMNNETGGPLVRAMHKPRAASTKDRVVATGMIRGA